MMMISTRKLIRMARKWQRKAAIARKRVTFSKKEVNDSSTTAAACSTTSSSSPVAEKGHFVVYTVDQKRYSFPIAYLNNYIFRELLRMSEEEFGLPSDGHITIPLEADFMDYMMSIIHRRATAEVLDKALLLSIKDYRCSSNICTVDDQLKIINHCSLIHCY